MEHTFVAAYITLLLGYVIMDNEVCVPCVICVVATGSHSDLSLCTLLSGQGKRGMITS